MIIAHTAVALTQLRGEIHTSRKTGEAERDRESTLEDGDWENCFF